MSKRRIFWFLAVAFSISSMVAIVVAIHQYPRRVLLSDVQQSQRITVNWGVADGNGTFRYVAFELDEPTRAEFVRELTENLGLDYFRGQATVTPMIGIYLTNGKNEPLAYYAIRCARGGGRCVSMESLRNMASKGRPLSEIEADEMFNDDGLSAKWPLILPSQSFDYVLPANPAEKNPLWEERRNVLPADPRLRATLQGHTKPVLSAAFSPDCGTLATGGWDRTIKLWGVATGKNTTTLTGHAQEVRSLAFSPDGQTLASAGGRDLSVKFWDITTGQNTATFHGHKELVVSVAYSPDGKTLVSGSADATIKLWEVASGENTATLTGHRSGIRSIAFSPDGKLLVSGSADATIKLWDVISGENTATLTGHRRGISSLAYSPDGKILASGSWDSTIKLWDVASSDNTATFRVPAPSAYGPVFVAFNPDGKTLASGGLGRKIKLWDVAIGKGIAILSGHSWNAGCVAFSPDGKMLASGSDNDNTVKLWDVETILKRERQAAK